MDKKEKNISKDFYSYITELGKYFYKEYYLNRIKYLYGCKFDYFDTLKFKGGLQKWQTSESKFEDIKTVSDMPAELESIIPISVVYQNLYSRLIGKKTNDKIFDSSGKVLLSDGNNYDFFHSVPNQWADVTRVDQ
jgi:hypothetical protein